MVSLSGAWPSGAPQPGMHLGLPSRAIPPYTIMLPTQGFRVLRARGPENECVFSDPCCRPFSERSQSTEYNCPQIRPVTDFPSSWKRATGRQSQPHTLSTLCPLGSHSEGRVSGGDFLGFSSFAFPFSVKKWLRLLLTLLCRMAQNPVKTRERHLKY